MEIKGAINFPLNFPFILLTGTGSNIVLTNLKKESIKDNVENKYVKEIKFTHTGGGIIENKITYADNTNTTQSVSGSNMESFLTGRFADLKTVGYIITNSTSTPLLNLLKTCINANENCIFYYLLASPKDVVNKSINFVNCDYVKYNHPITHRNITLDVEQTATDDKYNYVFLTVLNRYYYVTDAVLRKDIFTLTLQEDVLMSFKDLIYLQSAFIERNENDYNEDITDEYVTYDYDKSFTYTNLVPVNDIWDVDANQYNFVVTTIG